MRDEYVKPMFDVTWGPALAVFLTALESANGTLGGSLLTIASDDEIELAAENAAHSIDAYLVGIRTAVCAAGLCDHDPARTSFVRALSNFGGLGTGRLLEARHVRCVQTLLELWPGRRRIIGRRLGTRLSLPQRSRPTPTRSRSRHGRTTRRPPRRRLTTPTRPPTTSRRGTHRR